MKSTVLNTDIHLYVIFQNISVHFSTSQLYFWGFMTQMVPDILNEQSAFTLSDPFWHMKIKALWISEMSGTSTVNESSGKFTDWPQGHCTPAYWPCDTDSWVWQHCQYLYVHVMLHSILCVCVEGAVWLHCQYLYVHAVTCGTLNKTQWPVGQTESQKTCKFLHNVVASCSHQMPHCVHCTRSWTSCVVRWYVRAPLMGNDLAHTWHTKGRSFWWTCRWCPPSVLAYPNL
jgi:hypothetical protein